MCSSPGFEHSRQISVFSCCYGQPQYCKRWVLVSCIQLSRQMFMLSVAMRPHDSCCAPSLFFRPTCFMSIQPDIFFEILQKWYIYLSETYPILFLYGIFPLWVYVWVCAARRPFHCTLELLWRSVFKRILTRKPILM